MQDEEWLVAIWRGSWVITRTLCTASLQLYTVTPYFYIQTQKNYRFQKLDYCFFPFSTSYSHNGQSFTGEIEQMSNQSSISTPSYIFCYFQTPVSWRKANQPLPAYPTVWVRQREEIYKEGLRMTSFERTHHLWLLHSQEKTSCVAIISLPTYLWASRPWCETQQWMGWDWDWGSDWDCGCRGWGCCCCLRCGCCRCPPPDWPYRWWHS